MQDGRKAVWSIPYVSEEFFPSLKQNFIAYPSSKVSDCIFESHQLWQSGFSRVYSNCCCCCSFKPEIINIGQSSHKMYSNNIVNFQESTTILNVCTKKKSLENYWMQHVPEKDGFWFVHVQCGSMFQFNFLAQFPVELPSLPWRVYSYTPFALVRSIRLTYD